MQNGFEKILASLDDDRDLFAQIAVQVSRHYADYAEQIEMLLADGNSAGLARLLHKLKASWALYVPAQPELPAQLEMAVRAGDTEAIAKFSPLLLETLRTVSRQLELWVK